MTQIENFIGAQFYVGAWAIIFALAIGLLLSATRGKM